MIEYGTANDEVDVHIQIGHDDHLDFKWPRTPLAVSVVKDKIREARPEYANKILSPLIMGQRLAADATIDVHDNVNILCAVGGDLQPDQQEPNQGPGQQNSSQITPHEEMRIAGFEEEDVQLFSEHLRQMYGSLDTMTQLRYETEYVGENGEPGVRQQPIVNIEGIFYTILGASLGVSAILFISVGMFSMGVQRRVFGGLFLGVAISFVLRLFQTDV